MQYRSQLVDVNNHSSSGNIIYSGKNLCCNNTYDAYVSDNFNDLTVGSHIFGKVGKT